MKIFKNKISLSIMSAFVLMLASCGEEPKLGVPAQDNVAPDAPIFKEFIPGPGSAHIIYTQPSDLDLMCVVAEYVRNETTGVSVQTKSSPYTDTLYVEGFSRSGDFEIEMYSVDLSDNRSESIYATVTVEEPAVDVIFGTLNVQAGYGGIEVSWENETQTNIIVTVTMQDDAGDWIDLDQFFSTAASGSAAIRGLEDVETNFQIQIEDKWGNSTPVATYTITPLYEEQSDKDLYSKPALLPGDSPCWSSGYDIPDIWDGTYLDSGNSCYHSSSLADYKCITIDMGQVMKISRFMLYPRGGSHRFFTHNMIKYFKLYGALELTADMYAYTDAQAAQVASGTTYAQVTPSFTGWTPIVESYDAGYSSNTFKSDGAGGGTYICYKPSGDDDVITADDLDWVTEYGHEFNVSISCGTARYLRMQFIQSWSLSGIYQLAEFDLWGQAQE